MIKKCNIRDYATSAFRFYAAMGKLSSNDIKKKIKEIIYTESKREYFKLGIKGGYSDCVAYALEKSEREMEYFKNEILDIIAVENTLARVDKDTKRAIEIVYFTDAKKPLQKNDISDRVHKAELAIPASERQVYYSLKKARLIFAEERCLRIENEHKSEKNPYFEKVCSSRG